MKVALIESGVCRFGSSEVDSYFKIKFNAYNIDRLPWFIGDGASKTNKLINQFYKLNF